MPRVELPADVREKTIVVVAAYNEAACIESVLRELVVAYPRVVVVDDGSHDETGVIARRLVPHVLRHAVNRGKGAALQTAFTYLQRLEGDYVVTFDADGQHRVEDIAPLIAPLVDGTCEVTLGSRFLGSAVDMPLVRRLTLKLAILFTWLVSRVALTDAHNGMRAFSRKALSRIWLRADRMDYASELIDQICRSRLPFREVPVQIRYTDYSLAKGQTLRDAPRIALHYLLGRVTR